MDKSNDTTTGTFYTTAKLSNTQPGASCRPGLTLIASDDRIGFCLHLSGHELPKRQASIPWEFQVWLQSVLGQNRGNIDLEKSLSIPCAVDI